MPLELLNLFSPTNIIVFIIVLTRLSGFFISAPFFSTFPIPSQVKLWLCAFVAFLIYPILIAKGYFVVPKDMVALSAYLLLEFAIGFLIGFVANLIFVAVKVGGETLSIQVGLSASQTMDPSMGANNDAISQLYIYLAGFVFFAVNAHVYLFETIYQSFSTIPPGTAFVFNPDFVKQIVMFVNDVFVIGLKIVMPVFAVMFTVEILMAFVSKLMPQMNIFMVSLPFKILLGMLLILMFIIPTSDFMAKILQNYYLDLVKLLM